MLYSVSPFRTMWKAGRDSTGTGGFTAGAGLTDGGAFACGADSITGARRGAAQPAARRAIAIAALTLSQYSVTATLPQARQQRHELHFIHFLFSVTLHRPLDDAEPLLAVAHH